MSSRKTGSSLSEYYSFGLRVVLGWTMFWAFIDKLLGLGFATKAENAWIRGGSPTAGFLSRAAKGPFVEFFNSLSGQVWVDWLFMAGLFGIGVAFLLGIALRFAAMMGALMMMLMYFALMQPANNPVTDDHIVNALAFLLIGNSGAGEFMGLGNWWRKTSVVKMLPFLA